MWSGPILVSLVACAATGESDVRRPPDSGDAADTGDTQDTAPSLHPARVALPYVEVDDAAPSARLDGAAAASVEGPFAFEGDRVVFTGSLAEPTLAVGRVVWSDDDAATELAAVVGDPDLGALAWADGAFGTRVAEVSLPSAPNANGATSWSDDTVVIALSPSFVDDGVDVVTHLHGHNATVGPTLDAQALVEQFALSGRDAVFVAPQGPVNTPSGDFGQLMDEGGHERLVRDVIAALYRDGRVTWPVPGAQVLTAHSGGYYASAAIVRDGGLPIAGVHLYDALYGERATFRAFALDGGVLRSNYTEWGGTVTQNESLYDELAAVDVGDSDALLDLAADRATVTASEAIHTDCMRVRHVAARWLSASGLPFGEGAVPELLSVTARGDGARVRVAPDGDPDATVRVEGSDDGATWRTLATTDAEFTDVPAHAWYRARFEKAGVLSAASDAYGFRAGTGRWLVVDGFDRVLDGSWEEPAHAFAGAVALDSGLAVDAASDDAVMAGVVDLGAYEGVIWLLGDEGAADVTFEPAARAAVDAYVDGGGRLVVSGSEVGYATPSSFLQGTLGATFVGDDAGTTALDNGWTFGVAYPEDWPDVLGGGDVLWRYATGGAAAVVNGRVAVVGFPLETLDPADRAAAIDAIVEATAP